MLWLKRSNAFWKSCVSTPVLVPRIFRAFGFFRHQSRFFRLMVVQVFMRPPFIIFHLPVLGNLPCFIQYSEQVKILDFCWVCSVEPFCKSIMCLLIQLEKFELYVMFSGSLCYLQWDQFWSVVHPHFQRVAALCHDPIQHLDDSLSQDIQVDFYRQCFKINKNHPQHWKSKRACRRPAHCAWNRGSALV